MALPPLVIITLRSSTITYAIAFLSTMIIVKKQRNLNSKEPYDEITKQLSSVATPQVVFFFQNGNNYKKWKIILIKSMCLLI